MAMCPYGYDECWQGCAYPGRCYGPRVKTAGEIAYAADVDKCPNYNGGIPRKTWSQLDAIARWSWERNPTPRQTLIPIRSITYERTKGIRVTRELE